MAFTRPSISGSKAAWQRSSAAEHAPADRNPAPEASPGGLQNTDLSGGVGAGSTIVVQAAPPVICVALQVPFSIDSCCNYLP